MARREKIFIAGFSGSGKSTLLQELQRTAKEEWNFYDLDQEVLARYPQYTQLQDLISDFGWEKFRALERQGIEIFLKGPQKGIMALGGGAFNQLLWQIYGNHPKIMFCYLYSSFQDCWTRLELDSAEPRPHALRGKSELNSLYQERLSTYELIAWKIKNSANASMEELAHKFWDELQ